MTIAILDETQILKNIQSLKNPFFEQYFAFYSSWFNGIVKNPQFMLVPMDDHMVHRGDGVFEGLKVFSGAVYLLEQHLKRLFVSAEKIALQSPFDYQELKEIVLATARAADQDAAIIRIFLSRGPGGFTVNPYEPVKAQLYVMVHKLSPPAPEKYAEGVSIGLSAIPAKDGWMAQVKSCNYLPNVLMKKEAVDRKLDFVIGLDKNGYVTEGATENVMIVDKQGCLLHPELDNILKGTTMLRACELAREHGLPTAVKAISIADIESAQELMMAGTGMDVLPVTRFENKPVGNGNPGPVAKKLRELLQIDMTSGPYREVF